MKKFENFQVDDYINIYRHYPDFVKKTETYALIYYIIELMKQYTLEEFRAAAQVVPDLMRDDYLNLIAKLFGIPTTINRDYKLEIIKIFKKAINNICTLDAVWDIANFLFNQNVELISGSGKIIIRYDPSQGLNIETYKILYTEDNEATFGYIIGTDGTDEYYIGQINEKAKFTIQLLYKFVAAGINVIFEEK